MEFLRILVVDAEVQFILIHSIVVKLVNDVSQNLSNIMTLSHETMPLSHKPQSSVIKSCIKTNGCELSPLYTKL